MAITKLHDVHNRRRSRNVGLAGVLILFVILVMGLTMAKVTVGEQRAAAQSEAAN